MKLVQIDDWQHYHRDGEQFLKTANGAFTKRSKAFSPETLYNLTCMAIEKLVMAFLMKNGDLADNHTMGDLLLALERHLGHNANIAEKLRYLDQFQEICDLDAYSIVIPTEEDVVKFLRIGEEIRELLLPYLSDAARKSIH